VWQGCVSKPLWRDTMDIKRGKYILRSEPMCCWIEEEYEAKDRKTGKTKKAWKNISGYYPDFKMLCEEGLPKHLLVASDAKSMKKLVEEVRDIHDKIARMSYERVKEIAEGKE